MAMTVDGRRRLVETLDTIHAHLDNEPEHEAAYPCADEFAALLDTLWKYRRDENVWHIVRTFTKPYR